MAKPNYSFEKRQKEIAKKKKKEEKRQSKLDKKNEEEQAPLVDGAVESDSAVEGDVKDSPEE